ncbi:MAG: glycosyltransferase family 4 protein [Phycisphaeraceae bacterium]|nr:glycosyltransferase family 4 protein [Phycisphaeraceae bacterium]
MIDQNYTIHRRSNVAFVGTYVPRQCGLATFSQNLVRAITDADSTIDITVVAVNDRRNAFRYPSMVKHQIVQQCREDYRRVTEILNISRVDAVCLQHEHGIYGGADGVYVLEMVRRLRMPLITTLHTVLHEPSRGQRRVLMNLVRSSEHVVVMSERAKSLLQQIYHLPAEKISVIPHGIPSVPLTDGTATKTRFGLAGRKLILTFGLLGPGKGVQHMIQAMPTIIQQHPDVTYLVVGATHPRERACHGETYRHSLEELVERLNIHEHVIFYNRYLADQELHELLQASDIYVTPYVQQAQVCSGTLAYALGSGNAVVSTPYWHAQELLADDRGRLVPFGDAESLGRQILELLNDDAQRQLLRQRAYEYTRQMIWPVVAGGYLGLLTRSWLSQHAPLVTPPADLHSTLSSLHRHKATGNQHGRLSPVDEAPEGLTRKKLRTHDPSLPLEQVGDSLN